MIVPGSQTVSVTYTSQAACNAAAPTVINVTVNPLPNPAGPITGSNNVCPGSNNIAYSIDTINNATSYTWPLPPGANIATGAGTNSITVDFSANASSGDIIVWGNNLCGSGSNSPPLLVTVISLPGPADSITGVSDVCFGTPGESYSIAVIPNATGYLWTVPTGAVITSGNNTPSIMVDFTPSAVSGNITVQGTNQCGTGIISPDFIITVNPMPPTPVVTNIGDTLHSSSTSGNQWFLEGNLIGGAISQDYVATLEGYYWDVVTLNGCSSDTSNHKLIFITGINHQPGFGVKIYPVPNNGRFNVAISTNCSEQITISIYNNYGEKIYEEFSINVSNIIQKVINLEPISDGVYMIIFDMRGGIS